MPDHAGRKEGILTLWLPGLYRHYAGWAVLLRAQCAGGRWCPNADLRQEIKQRPGPWWHSFAEMVKLVGTIGVYRISTRALRVGWLALSHQDLSQKH